MKPSFFRPFLASFLLTALFMGFVAGFLAVDASTQTYGLDKATPLLSWKEEGPLDLTVTFMGETLPIPLPQINQAARFVQKYATLLIPRSLRFVGQGITYGALSFEQWRQEELERRYQESIE